jgi:hypothetical protein
MMTAEFDFDFRLALLLLVVLVIVMFQELGWFDPAIRDQEGIYPMNDCGKNYTLVLKWDPDRHCELLTVSEEMVERVRRQIEAEEEKLHPGEIRGEDSLDKALQFIERMMRGFQ